MVPFVLLLKQELCDGHVPCEPVSHEVFSSFVGCAKRVSSSANCQRNANNTTILRAADTSYLCDHSTYVSSSFGRKKYSPAPGAAVFVFQCLSSQRCRNGETTGKLHRESVSWQRRSPNCYSGRDWIRMCHDKGMNRGSRPRLLS